MQDYCRRLPRPYLALSLILGSLACYLIANQYGWTKATWHYRGKTTVSAPQQRPGFSRIFFLETGGHGLITARIACAVESAARVHPNWTVYLLSVAFSEEASKRNGTFTGPFTQMLQTIPNVVMSAIMENGEMVSNGFLAFSRGDPFLLYLMLRAREVYRPEEWSSIGPQLLHRVTLAQCGAREVKALLGRRCGGDTGFTVIPHWMFLPVPYDRWESFFVANASREAWLMSSASYVMHVYNKMSSKTPAVPGSAYRQAAETNCPDSLRLSLQSQNTF